MKSLQELIEQLPPELQREVRDFAEFLIQKYGGRTPGTPSLRWAGALRDLGTRYTSVELQHAILQREVRDFAEFLIQKYGGRTPGMPSLRWAGALRDLGTRYTSVELQHAILRWRAGEPLEPAEPEP